MSFFSFDTSQNKIPSAILTTDVNDPSANSSLYIFHLHEKKLRTFHMSFIACQFRHHWAIWKIILFFSIIVSYAAVIFQAADNSLLLPSFVKIQDSAYCRCLLFSGRFPKFWSMLWVLALTYLFTISPFTFCSVTFDSAFENYISLRLTHQNSNYFIILQWFSRSLQKGYNLYNDVLMFSYWLRR